MYCYHFTKNSRSQLWTKTSAVIVHRNCKTWRVVLARSVLFTCCDSSRNACAESLVHVVYSLHIIWYAKTISVRTKEPSPESAEHVYVHILHIHYPFPPAPPYSTHRHTVRKYSNYVPRQRWWWWWWWWGCWVRARLVFRCQHKSTHLNHNHKQVAEWELTLASLNCTFIQHEHIYCVSSHLCKNYEL